MQGNIKNRTIFCKDNLDILSSMDSGSIDLIYLDPPFNKNKVFTAPIGSSAEGAEFSDIFREEDVRDEWLQTIEEDDFELHSFLSGIKNVGNHYNYCYLCYMAIRLIECHRVLKDTGSIYLHCDPTMSHYLKIVLDCIFGERNFQNEVITHYTAVGLKAKSKKFHQNTECIFYYVKAKGKHIWNAVYEKYSDPSQYRTASMHVWNKVTKKAERKRGEDGKIQYFTVDRYKADNFIELPALRGNEKTGYPTQKPLKLLERIIKASSNAGEVVLDPFCGCATTCVAAEKLGRRWIGIDVSVKAYELVKERLGKEVEWKGSLLEQELVTFQTIPPTRTDTGQDYVVKKYVYVMSNAAYQGDYKVGIALDVDKRLSSYQTSDPARGYKIEYKLHTPRYREIEKALHNDSNLVVRHEWVQGDLRDIIKQIDLLNQELA